MERLHSMKYLALVAFSLLLVLLPAVGVAEEGASGEGMSEEGAPAAREYEWHSCAENKVRFAAPKGWHIGSEEVADGVVVCSVTPGAAAGNGLKEGRFTLEHWSKWPLAVGVQPNEYAVTAIQKLSMMGRVIDQHSGAQGASLVNRIEVVTTSGEQEMHKWVLFVAHPRQGTLDMVTAEWPEGAWEEAWEIVRPTVSSLRFADQE